MTMTHEMTRRRTTPLPCSSSRCCAVGHRGTVRRLQPATCSSAANSSSDFRPEGGVVPRRRASANDDGNANAAGDNAILLPSHYGHLQRHNWLIRGAARDRARDQAHDYLILTELFGNGRSSSPSNTPEPFHGPRFPVMTIRDNVDAVHRLLTEQLHVKHLRAVVGFSMGAEQAFQWAVSHPTFMDAIVATSGTAKCYGHGFVRLEGQIAALTADPAWRGGDYTTPPEKGLEAFGMVWARWLYFFPLYTFPILRDKRKSRMTSSA